MSMTQEDINIQRIRNLLQVAPDEMDAKVEKSHHFMNAVKDLIDVCGDDPNRQGLEETPYRVLKAFLEYTEGYRENPRDHLEKQFDVEDRKSTRLNSSHVAISYAVFCLKKKKKQNRHE